MPLEIINRFTYGTVDKIHTRRKEFPDNKACTKINNFNIANNGSLVKRRGISGYLPLDIDSTYRINEFGKSSVLVVRNKGTQYGYQIIDIRAGIIIGEFLNDNYPWDMSRLRFYKVNEGVLLFDGIVADLILVKTNAELEVYPTSTLKPKYIRSATIHQSSLVLLGLDNSQDKAVLSISDPTNWREYQTGSSTSDRSFQLTFTKRIEEDYLNVISFSSMLVVSTTASFFSVVSGTVTEIGINNTAISVLFSTIGTANRELNQVDQYLFYISKDLKTMHLKNVLRPSVIPQFVDEDIVLKPQYTFENEIFRIIKSRNYQTGEVFLLSGNEVFKLQKSALSFPESAITFALTKYITSSEINILDMTMIDQDTEMFVAEFGSSKSLAFVDPSDKQPIYLDLFLKPGSDIFEMSLTGDRAQTADPAFTENDATYGSLIVSLDEQRKYLIKTFVSPTEVILSEVVPDSFEEFYISKRYVQNASFAEKTVQGVEDNVFLGETVATPEGLIVFAKNFITAAYGLPIAAEVETGAITATGELGMKTDVQRIVVEDLRFEVAQDRPSLVISGLDSKNAKGRYEVQYNYGFSTNEPVQVTVEDNSPFPLQMDTINITYEIKTF